MSIPARMINFCGEAETRAAGESLLVSHGDAVIIRRGPLRSLLMKCPDGCGDTLSVNLDARAGKAWKLDLRGQKITLYPSVWRDGGCGSHFILWRDRILWCGRFERENVEPPYEVELENKLLMVLKCDLLVAIEDLAEELDEIPWEVGRAARSLARKGKAESGWGDERNMFRLKRA